MDIEYVIEAIESRQLRFWTSALGHTAFVFVDVHPASARQFVQTEADSVTENNLGSMPECP